MALTTAARAADTLFSDNFASAAAWQVVQGKFEAAAGRLVAQGHDAAVAVLKGRRFDNFVLDVDMLRPARGYVGVALRRQSESKPWSDAYHLCSLRPGHFRIIAKRGGRYDAPLFDSSRVAELQPGAVVHLRVWIKRGHLRVWINNRLVANVRDESPLPAGGISLNVGSGGAKPRAEFRRVVVRTADAVPPPRPDEIPPASLAEIVAQGEAELRKRIPSVKKQLASAKGRALSDAELQDRASQAHALLWRYYYAPRTHMVYTIIEPHTGQPVLPTIEEVRRGRPNKNGWATPIEDCAGYGNGKHLAWLVERYEATHRAEHADDARRVLAGALHLGEIRPADEHGFAEVVRGVLPDNTTYYEGRGRGSSGDNYNGYSYGLWRYARSTLATPDEKARIANVMRRTCYPGATIFSAMAGDVTQDPKWRQVYLRRAKATARSMAGWTVESRQNDASWTAVQQQVRLAALAAIESDPTRRAAYRLALRVNAWSRWKDVLAGLTYDPANDAYVHRVNTVRRPLDGMLTVMLAGDREAIDAFLPAFRRVVAGYDFRDFRDQRQLTPFIGAYWLGVRQSALRYDPGRPACAHVALNPLDPKRDLVLTYFPNCNAYASGVTWRGPGQPDGPNWSARLNRAKIDAADGALRVRTQPDGEARFEAVSAPWVRYADAASGYTITFRARVVDGILAVHVDDGSFAAELRLTRSQVRIAGQRTVAVQSNTDWRDYRVESRNGALALQIDEQPAATVRMAKSKGPRRLWWGGGQTGGPNHFLCAAFGFETREPFRYPAAKR